MVAWRLGMNNYRKISKLLGAIKLTDFSLWYDMGLGKHCCLNFKDFRRYFVCYRWDKNWGSPPKLLAIHLTYFSMVRISLGLLVFKSVFTSSRLTTADVRPTLLFLDIFSVWSEIPLFSTALALPWRLYSVLNRYLLKEQMFLSSMPAIKIR